jgi:acetate kinase
MKILVVNCGSSSIKYQVYDVGRGAVIEKSVVANIGKSDAQINRAVYEKRFSKAVPVANHTEAFDLIFATLVDPDEGVVQDLSEICAVGHRAAHGGALFSQSTLIDDETLAQLERCISLAPLHNPMNLLGIRLAQRMLPHAKQVAVFDTGFHQALPARVRVFPISYRYFAELGIQRVGFHSQSYRYVIPHAARLAARRVEEMKMVICHLGHGATITAIDGGRSIDTSVGFSSFAGMMMGTRPGDFDPGLIFYLNRELGIDLKEIERMLYNESGLLGVSGVSSDMRVLLEHAGMGDPRCELAVEMFTYRAKKFIGAYTAALGGLDLLVFTAGIGENSPEIRRRICAGLECLGISLDQEKNDAAVGKEASIGAAHSPVQVLVVPTNEELVIIEDTLRLAGLETAKTKSTI